MDSELSLDRPTYTQLARLRALGEATLLRGSEMAALALSAKLVCWIAKIAYEIAIDMNAAVLLGAYCRDATLLIDALMAQPGTEWPTLFMSNILRVHGEGTLSMALSGPLANMAWCRGWVAGMPTSRAGALADLQHAEAAFAEARTEEDRKVNEWRHCPHCRQTFIVAQVNCGQFHCGRADGAIVGAHGCGKSFRLEHSPPYTTDEAILAPFRAHVIQVRSRLDLSQHGEIYWERARAMTVPPVTVLVKHEAADSILPCMHLVSAASEIDDSSHQLMRMLWEATQLTSRLSILPDLIEVRQLVHLCCCLVAHLYFEPIYSCSSTYGLAIRSVFWRQRTMHSQ
jgi:hypothetical protein